MIMKLSATVLSVEMEEVEKKWSGIENFITQTVQHKWECRAPITPEQLQHMVMHHIKNSNDAPAIDLFINGKRNTFNKLIQRVLKRNKFSV